MSIGYPTTGDHYGHCPLTFPQMNPLISNTICARPNFLPHGVEEEARGRTVIDMACRPFGDQALVDALFPGMSLESIIDEEIC